jgi:hypothetical protein
LKNKKKNKKKFFISKKEKNKITAFCRIFENLKKIIIIFLTKKNKGKKRRKGKIG